MAREIDLNEDFLEEGIQSTNLIEEAIELFDRSPQTITGEIEEPKVGMDFQNGEELAAFCFTYSYKIGFEWFIRSNKLLEEYKKAGVKRKCAGENEPRFHMFQRLRLACKKGGAKTSRKSNVTGCGVYVEACLHGQKMVISQCMLDHNHQTLPNYSHLMVGYRNISDYFKRRMLLNDSAGISVHKNFNSLALEAGGHDKLPFNRRDLRNLVNGERRMGRLTGDAAGLEDYFKKMKRENPNYYYRIDSDENGVLVNMFWADARCRSMAKDFGDAVSFDTTFLCNRYGMPFAPFIGVNHHGSSVLLAAALISNEDTRSFEWVFESWLECMHKPPSVIVTDQDLAMGNAIRNVFPSTPHKLCLWHMMKNAGKHLGKLSNGKNISESFGKVVHNSIEESEFEGAWNEFVDEFGLQNNAWLKEAYEIRRRWAPAYWKGVFCAGMSSTQRSEGQNRFFKSYLSQNSDLLSVVKQIEIALHTKALEEKGLNFECIDRPPFVDTSVLAMAVFHKVYTNAKYLDVIDEVYGLLHVNVTIKDQVGGFTRYAALQQLDKPSWNKWEKVFDVEIDKDNGEFSCECKLFEFSGILCRHILRCIDVARINNIPEKYILDRWRKDLVRDYEKINAPYYNPEESDRVKRLMDIAAKNENISKLALQDDEAFEKYQRAANGLIKELQQHIGIDNVESSRSENVTTRVWCRRRLQPRESNPRHITQNAIPNDGGLKDPPAKRGNGRATKGKKPLYKSKRRMEGIFPY